MSCEFPRLSQQNARIFQKTSGQCERVDLINLEGVDTELFIIDTYVHNLAYITSVLAVSG